MKKNLKNISENSANQTKISKDIKWLIGIDEVGRGPVAGPVTVCAVMINIENFNFDELIKMGLRDSKKMTPTKREKISNFIKENFESNQVDKNIAKNLYFSVTHIEASVIDKIGIVPSIRKALEKSINNVTERVVKNDENKKPEDVFDLIQVLLDGGLVAPDIFKKQKTIIRGDNSEPVIALASILAKVDRDNLMVSLSKKYLLYGFEKHKGYGTMAHMKAIDKNGLNPEHRLTFLTKRDKK